MVEAHESRLKLTTEADDRSSRFAPKIWNFTENLTLPHCSNWDHLSFCMAFSVVMLTPTYPTHPGAVGSCMIHHTLYFTLPERPGCTLLSIILDIVIHPGAVGSNPAQRIWAEEPDDT